MKSYLLCFLFLLPIAPLFSQEHEYSSYAFEFYAGYSRVNFLNAAYSKNFNDNAISRQAPNVEAGMRAINRFFMMNASFLLNEYKVENNMTLFAENTTQFQGLEAGISLFLTPLLSKHFSPYLGIGYVGGGLYIEKKTTTGAGSSQTTSSTVLASSAINSPLWKFGAMLAYKRVSLTAEYRQTFSTPDKAFQQGSVTFAYRLINR